MALGEYVTTHQLKDLAAQYPDMEITREDSLNAGNCESGTDEFLETYFGERTSVKVSELVEHIDEFSGVCIVLTYKFRQLEQAEESAKPKEGNAGDTNLDHHPF